MVTADGRINGTVQNDVEVHLETQGHNKYGHGSPEGAARLCHNSQELDILHMKSKYKKDGSDCADGLTDLK